MSGMPWFLAIFSRHACGVIRRASLPGTEPEPLVVIIISACLKF
jgi:hypothetical protein